MPVSSPAAPGLTVTFRDSCPVKILSPGGCLCGEGKGPALGRPQLSSPWPSFVGARTCGRVAWIRTGRHCGRLGHLPLIVFLSGVMGTHSHYADRVPLVYFHNCRGGKYINKIINPVTIIVRVVGLMVGYF